MRAHKAFSLIEIVIVLIVMSILALLALPKVNNLFSKENDFILQRKLLDTIYFAYEEAILRQQDLGVLIDKNQLIIFVDANHDGSVSHASQIIRKIKMPLQQGVLTWRSFPFYRNYLLFRPNLDLISDNGTFWYCMKGKKNPLWAISIASTAQARILYPDEKHEIKDGQGNPLVCLIFEK